MIQQLLVLVGDHSLVTQLLENVLGLGDILKEGLRIVAQLIHGYKLLGAQEAMGLLVNLTLTICPENKIILNNIYNSNMQNDLEYFLKMQKQLQYIFMAVFLMHYSV